MDNDICLLAEVHMNYADHVQIEVKEGKLSYKKMDDIKLPKGISVDVLDIGAEYE